MATAEEAASKDIQLLETVLTRFAMCEDEQLEKQLKTLLIPVMQKMNTSNEVVKKKVLEVLGHVNKRVKPLQSIKLPIRELTELFLKEPPTSLVCSFIIMYLDMGFGRIEKSEQANIAPELMKGISNRTLAQRESLLPIFQAVLEHIKIPEKEDRENDPRFQFTKSQNDMDTIFNYFLDTMFAQISTKPDEKTYGLSKKAVRHIASKTPNKEFLLSRKIAILEFITKSGIFSENDMGVMFLVGTCDTHHTVVQKSEDGMKRIKIDYDDKKFITKLFGIYQGTMDKTSLHEDDRRHTAHPILKGKLINCFSRSTEASNSFPNTVQIIFDCVYGQDASIKLKSSGMTFAQWVFRTANDQQINMMAPIILSGLLKLIRELTEESYAATTETNKLLSFTYSAVGILARRTPQLFSKDISVLNMYLTALSKTKDESVTSSITEGLLSMCHAYRNVDKAQLEEIKILISLQLAKKEASCRYVSIYYSNRLFPFSSAFARVNNLFNTDDVNSSVRDESIRGMKSYVWRDKDRDIVPEENSEFPDFLEMVKCVVDAVEHRKKNPNTIFPGNTKNHGVFTLKSYEHTIRFLRECLEVTTKKTRHNN